MYTLPVHLQERIYAEAAVRGVCRASRQEVFRCALLAGQRDVHTPFEEGEDGPAPRPTWSIAHMAGPSSGEMEAQLGAALRRVGQRFEQLQHVSISVAPGPHRRHRSSSRRGLPKNILSGLLRFIQHVAPTLVNGTRLTIRGHQPALPRHCRALPWQLLSRTTLGAACTRLDVSADKSAITLLLLQLADSFPVVRDVRVRCHRSGGFVAGYDEERIADVMTLVAPDSLTHLTAVLSPTYQGEGCAGVCPLRARGLQELVCCTVPPNQAGRGNLVDLWQVDAPVLHTVRGRPWLVLSPVMPLHGLRCVEASLGTVKSLGPADLQGWLLQCQGAAPGLTRQALVAVSAQSDGACAITAAQLKHRELVVQKDAMQRASHRARTAVGEAQKMVAHFQSHQTALEAGGELDAAVRLLFQALPTDLGELQAVLEGLQQEAADIVGNAVDVAAYLERQRKITDVEADLARQVADLAAVNVDLVSKKDEWLPALETVVETVNQSFGLNLAKMGCASEVKLLEHEDYDQYAMQIWAGAIKSLRVKFRPEQELHLLTASRQSGGERAVCTMLYLIALQGVAQTSFRVVDEINQGMDALNERNVFSLVVDSSCQPGPPQCFMLTPKLLKNMNFQSLHITVHNIMSGGHLATGMTARINMEEGMFGSRVFEKRPAVGAA